jgi:uncharacterized protein (TIGR00369 family)
MLVASDERIRGKHFQASGKAMALSDNQLHALVHDRSMYPPSALHLGIDPLEYSVDGGWAEAAFSPRPEFANPAGSVQGGFVCAMLDETMSFAATLSRRFETMMVTLQTSVTYLRPTPVARVIARGELLRFGTTGVAMQGTLRDAGGQVLAVATATAVPRPLVMTSARGKG